MKRFRKLMLVLMLLVLVLSVVACKGNTKSTENSPKVDTIENKTETKVEAVTSFEVDEASGLKIEGNLELKYAKSFQLLNLENGVKKFIDVEGREVYLLPSGVTLENDELLTLNIPVNRIAIFSTVDATLLRPIGKLDTIVATTSKAETWRIPEVKEKVESGEIAFLGSKSALNTEELQKVNPEVVWMTYENLDRTATLIDTFNNLGLNWLGFSNHMENDPRARIEWVKLAGVLTGELEKAEEYYNAQLEKIDAVEKKTAVESGDKPTFAWTFLFNDLFYTKKAGDYSTKTAELAGGIPIFIDLEPGESGNSKLSAEEFYKGAEEADFLIYDSISGAEIKTIEDLIKYADYMADMKSVKDNKVWGVKPIYFQSADYTAEMIEELYEILHSTDSSLKETVYFYRMDSAYVGD